MPVPVAVYYVVINTVALTAKLSRIKKPTPKEIKNDKAKSDESVQNCGVQKCPEGRGGEQKTANPSDKTTGKNGIISENNSTKEMSAREIKNARQRGVNRAKSKERELIKNGHPGTADDGWSLAERKRIAEKGQYPSDTRWHHVNDVKRNPSQASNPDNVIPSRGGTAGHVSKHHPQGTRAGSSGATLNRDQLLKDHMNWE